MELAKLLLEVPRRDTRKRAIELLKVTASAAPRLEASECEIEEAQQLLAELEVGVFSRTFKPHWFDDCEPNNA